MLSHADGGGDDGTDCGLRVRLLGALGPCDLLTCAASDREPGACTSVGSLGCYGRFAIAPCAGR